MRGRTGASDDDVATLCAVMTLAEVAAKLGCTSHQLREQRKAMGALHPRRRGKKQVPCAGCGVATENPRFCSRTCAARVTNVETVKRKRAPPVLCECGETAARRRQKCSKCIAEERERSRAHSLGAVQRKQDGPWRHATVRTHCRQRNAHRPRACQNCGYDKHVEFCHIKPICTFDASALLADVNAESNVAILCRNCHWEMDHGLLKPRSWEREKLLSSRG